MSVVRSLAETVGLKASCEALAVARPTYYRRQRPKPVRTEPAVRAPNPRRYSDAEREAMLQVLNSPRFVDCSPEQVEATLAEDNQRIGSARTMYRVLAEAGQLHERRHRRPATHHAVPQLVARAPNQVWSWDITKLRGAAAGLWYMLYVVLDLYSRFVVGWLLAERENAKTAQHLLRETMRKYAITPGQLTVHQDRGSPMRASSTMQLLDELGVTRSYSRPRVSNDNPFSESAFATLKARPQLPERLGSVVHGRQVLRDVFRWYNYDHHHRGIAMLTPAQVHFGQAEQVLAQRYALRMAAYEANPLRFIGGPPKLQTLPAEVWINPPTDPVAQILDASAPGDEEVLH
jgi:putative transposase